VVARNESYRTIIDTMHVFPPHRTDPPGIKQPERIRASVVPHWTTALLAHGQRKLDIQTKIKA